MAEFTRQRGKRQEDGGLGSVLDLLLANARLVLGVSGAAVLAIATLAVKRVRLARPPSGLGGRERTAIPWRRATWLPGRGGGRCAENRRWPPRSWSLESGRNAAGVGGSAVGTELPAPTLRGHT